MKVRADKYCVYCHKHKDIIFYIGVGNIDRAFEILGRSGKWYLFLEGIDNEYEVEVISWFDDRQEAEKFEAEQIQKYLPYGNKEAWYPQNREETKRRWIEVMKMSEMELSDNPFLQPN